MKKFKAAIAFSISVGLVCSGIVLSGIWKERKTITAVELQGNITISKKEIFDFAKLTDSLLMSDELKLQMIEERISKHPGIRSVNARRETSKLIIEVSEKEPFAIIIPAHKDSPMLMIDDKLNLYYYKKEMAGLNIPVVTGLSDKIDIDRINQQDYNKLAIARFIITQSIKIDKLLYNYLSEISFRDSASIFLYTFDNGIPVKFVDDNCSSPRRPDDNYLQYFSLKNELLIAAINRNLVHLYNFVKQVMIYEYRNSIETIDLCYPDMIVVKNKHQS